ncbi:MAG TPA: sigma-70 family RNA polymerase sigma factor [Chitinophagaceae bacterium]|nr:sigma-70 family RNA polymerase sigma factor [Chitinophagaceae bacterium]
MEKVMDRTNSTETVKCWVELYSDHLYTWAFRKTSDKETAEDLVQETFLVAFQNFEKFEGKSHPKTWLFSILKNKIADHYRKLFKEGGVQTISFNDFFDENGDWLQEHRPIAWKQDETHLLDDPDFKKALDNCIDRLQNNYKAVVTLRFSQEKESDEVCQELGIAATNYWQLLHRAKLQLRKCLYLNWFRK